MLQRNTQRWLITNVIIVHLKVSQQIKVIATYECNFKTSFLQQSIYMCFYNIIYMYHNMMQLLSVRQQCSIIWLLYIGSKLDDSNLWHTMVIVCRTSLVGALSASASVINFTCSYSTLSHAIRHGTRWSFNRFRSLAAVCCFCLMCVYTCDNVMWAPIAISYVQSLPIL